MQSSDECRMALGHRPPVRALPAASCCATNGSDAPPRLATCPGAGRPAAGRRRSGCYALHRPTLALGVQDMALSIFSPLRGWARAIKRDVVALWLAARDPRTPWPAKVAATAVAAYALSPIDLIPDFIPVLGYLDDVIIVPLGILLAVRLVPPDLMAEFRAEAERREGRPTSRTGAAVIVTLWIASAAFLLWWFWPTLAG